MFEESFLYFAGKLKDPSSEKINKGALCLILSAYERVPGESLNDDFFKFQKICQEVNDIVNKYSSEGIVELIEKDSVYGGFVYFSLTPKGKEYSGRILSSLSPESAKSFEDSLEAYYKRQAIGHSNHARVDRGRDKPKY